MRWSGSPSDSIQDRSLMCGTVVLATGGEPVVRVVVEFLGIEPDSLGKAGKRGILKSIMTRRESLFVDPDWKQV